MPPIATTITTTDQHQRPRPITLGIEDLVALTKLGRLRVPGFQRAFIWDAEDVRKLLDSVWRGYPIGVLVLSERDAPAEQATFGPLPIDWPAVPDAYWVVDGQHRVISLVASLARISDEADPRFELAFDLRVQRFVNTSRRGTPDWWLPLRVALDSRSLLSWLREHGDALTDEELDAAEALSGALRDYLIPAYVIQGDDESLLWEILDRVNNAGKKIGRAQIFHALYANDSEPGSPQSVVAALRHEGFGQLDENRVVQSLLAIRGGNVARDLHGEFGPKETPTDWYDATEAALSKTVRFLRAQGLPHVLLAPSTFPVPVIAAFYHLHPDPDPWYEQLLARWVWRGWAHGYGRGAQTPALRQAVQAVNPTTGKPDEAPSEYGAVTGLLAAVTDEPAKPPDPDNFRTNEAASRLALLALASLEPCDLDGAPLDVAAELEKHGVETITELVPGRRSSLGARGFWPVGARRPTGSEPAEILASHAIDDEAAHLLRAGDRAAFVARRGAAIAELTRRFTDAHLQHGSPVRPALADLIVGDDDPDAEPDPIG